MKNISQDCLASVQTKPSNIMRYFITGIFLCMFASCNKNLEVDITPATDPVRTITYNTAECIYYGNTLGNGAASFMLNLYNSPNSDTGICMMGFCTMPGSFDNFKLDVGVYNFASNGTVRTLYPYMLDNNTKVGTFLYDYSTSKFTLIPEGSLTVTQSGNTYTLSANLKGIDSPTGNTVVRFSGSINFKNATEIPNSAYTATGIPKLLKNPGDNTWSGILTSGNNSTKKRLAISNFGNDDITVFCDVEDGQIKIDNYTKIVSNDAFNGYFEVGYIDGDKLHTLPFDDYVVKYDPVTRILDFSGTVTVNGRTFEALVGIAAYSNTTGSLGSVFTDFYANVKLQLPPATTRSLAVWEPDSVAGIFKKMDLMQRSSKSANDRNKTNSVINRPDTTTGLQKISVKDLSVISSSQFNLP